LGRQGFRLPRPNPSLFFYQKPNKLQSLFAGRDLFQRLFQEPVDGGVELFIAGVPQGDGLGRAFADADPASPAGGGGISDTWSALMKGAPKGQALVQRSH
jgi:hypothetical protein